jgi:hypothetical protein
MSPAAGEQLSGAHREGTAVEARRVFIGAGCNRVVNNVSWGACGLVAFGTQNAVALFSPLVCRRAPLSFFSCSFSYLKVYPTLVSPNLPELVFVRAER